MSNQSARETVLNKTLHLLVRKIGLTPAEVAQLRLAHLHLAGKSPNISFTPAGSDKPKTVELDLDAHRALVGWLVARPDSKSDFLFPGSHAGAMDTAEIEQAVEAIAGPAKAEAAAETPEEPAAPPPAAAPPPPPSPPPPPPVDATMAAPPPFFRPEPPPSRPEMGPPPPGAGMDETMVSPLRPAPQPPPSAPEGETPVKIPLPAAGPKPPAPRPSEPAKAAAKKTAQPPAGATPPADKTPPPAGAVPRQAATAGPPQKPGPVPARSKARVTAAEAAKKVVRKSRQSPTLNRFLVPAVVLVILLPCVVCLGGGWLVSQTGPARSLLAQLGLAGEEPVVEEAATIPAPVFAPTVSSPLPTPTLPPTLTPTPPPPTNTPPPTETATPVPTETTAPAPTNTPAPAPTDTPTQTPTPTPSEPPTPTPTPTPAMKYGAPVLLEPEDGFAFIPGNTITLRWQPVPDLAPDEQYAVRLIYKFQNEIVYQGTNVKEPEWTLPLSLFGQVDGPDNLYEWFVVIERTNDDGSGTAISPESEHRTFTWK